jgi:hypothetical protein
MWEPRPLATLRTSKVCNRDVFTFYLTHWIRLWVDTRAGVEVVENKISIAGYEAFTTTFRKSSSYLLGCNAVYSDESQHMFRRNNSPPSSGLEE